MFLWVRWLRRGCFDRRRSKESTAYHTNCYCHISGYRLCCLFLHLDRSDDDVAILRPGIRQLRNSFVFLIISTNPIFNSYRRINKLRFPMSLNKLAGLPSCGSLISAQFSLFVRVFSEQCFRFLVFFMRWQATV